MQTRYLPVKQTLYAHGSGQYLTYGIAAVCFSQVDCQIPVFVSDVSADFTFVSRLTELFNREQLHPVHLLDVLHDFIG